MCDMGLGERLSQGRAPVWAARSSARGLRSVLGGWGDAHAGVGGDTCLGWGGLEAGTMLHAQVQEVRQITAQQREARRDARCGIGGRDGDTGRKRGR